MNEEEKAIFIEQVNAIDSANSALLARLAKDHPAAESAIRSHALSIRARCRAAKAILGAEYWQ